jgi:hypothetical protein
MQREPADSIGVAAEGALPTHWRRCWSGSAVAAVKIAGRDVTVRITISIIDPIPGAIWRAVVKIAIVAVIVTGSYVTCGIAYPIAD